MWQPRRAADTSTNWRQSLFCCCTASMEQSTDGAETAAIDGHVSSWSENILFHSAYGHQDIRNDSVMRLRSSSRGRNTSASVTVYVTGRSQGLSQGGGSSFDLARTGACSAATELARILMASEDVTWGDRIGGESEILASAAVMTVVSEKRQRELSSWISGDTSSKLWLWVIFMT